MLLPTVTCITSCFKYYISINDLLFVFRWEEAKLLLMKDGFIRDLQFYDKDHIPEKIYEKLSIFVSEPLSKPTELIKISVAANQLSIWMHAIHSYGSIVRALQPKKDRLKIAEDHIYQVCYY